jgi:nitrite reductase (NADH) large subunit
MKHLIVGNGVAGVTAAQAILRTDPDAEVHIYGAEPYPYYRRPLLWEFIAGEIEQEDVFFQPEEWYTERGIQLHLATRVTNLDPAARTITLEDGSQETYDRLLLVTGAHPFVPPCGGTDKRGVFTLRTLDDAIAIKAYAEDASRALVVGGGLLGLETARALHATGLAVTVIEVIPYLLPRQLDEEGARVLEALMEQQGLHIVTDATVDTVLGDEAADSVQLKDGRVLEGELVLFSAGIRCRAKLAEEAGLEVNRGVIVDGQLRTSAKDVFAAGDVAEFEGTVYGIIPAAVEQARAAGANMAEPGKSTYEGTVPSTTLKVAGAEVTTLGEALAEGEAYEILRRADVEAGRYRKFVLRDGHVVGAILLNDKPNLGATMQLVNRQVDVSEHQEELLSDDFELKTLL